MSYYDGLKPAYTFRLRIERDDREILDTAITVKSDADEITKAKKSVRRLLDEYTPVIKATEPESTQDPPEPEAHEAAATEPGEQTSDKRPEGAKGLLRLCCRECGNTFGTFLREYQSEITCRCGHHIDLTAPLARYRFICPYCQHEGWGKTNSEDPEIEVQCKCREMITVRWNPDAREYQN